MQLGVRSFSEADQQAFARLSGDRNPMHMDRAAARRTQMGLPVVHGVHGVLWALDLACRQGPLPPGVVKVNFAGPIYVGETAEAVLANATDDQVRIQLKVGGVTATTITVQREAAARPAGPPHEAPHPETWPEAPLPLDFAEMPSQQGAFRLARPEDEAAAAFPALSQQISALRLGAWAALSRLVGMVCPGLHSIFSGMEIALAEPTAPALAFQVIETDPRFRLVRVAVDGCGLTGELTAFARLPPVEQPSLADIARHIPSGVFSGATALVLGGSRGLGEVTAKALAAGGAKVVVTYASGRDEAERVAAEIRGAGGVCEIAPFDARGDIAAQLGPLGRATHVYYFATGPIALRRTRFVDAEVLADFMRFYGTAFVEVCEALSGAAGQPPLRAFYPSSVAVEDAPKGWVEYAMAKAAGETLCREINARLPGVEVVMHRLPRVLTDQTASVRAGAGTPVLDVMLPIVREVQQA